MEPLEINEDGFDLPEGWVEVTLSDVAYWGSGGTPSRSNPNYYGGSIPWVKTGELSKGIILTTEEYLTEDGLKNSSAKVFPKGSIAVAMYGATIGKVALFGIDASTNQACAVAIPNGLIISSKFLFHYLVSQKAAFVAAGQGGAQPNISQGIIKSWPIPLPPLPEQIRIADKLDALLPRVEVGRERLERVPGLLKRFRQSVLSAAASGELTQEWREKEDPHDFLDIEALSDAEKVRRGVGQNIRLNETNWIFPEIWQRQTVSYLLVKGIIKDVKDGNHGSNHPKVEEFTKEGLPFITAAQVNNRRIDYASAYKISGEPLSKLRVGFAKIDDVIFTHKGSVGRVAVADRDCILSPQTTYYRVDSKYLSPNYLSYFLLSPAFSNQLEEVKSQTTRDFVPISQQYALWLLIPPLPEQIEIVRRVEALFAIADRIEARYQLALTTFDRMTPALLAKAFRGEMVPQDSNDEPASVLLERIQTARAAVDEKPKRGRGAAKGAAKMATGADGVPVDGPQSKRRGRPPRAQAEVGSVLQATSDEDAVQKLEAQKLQRAQGTRQISLFGAED